MRHKIVTILAVGAIGAASFAVAGPALADATAPTATSVGATVTSHVERLKQAMAGLVTDKTLTQDQADKVAETLSSNDLGRGRPGGPGGRHGPGGSGLDAAATALTMTEADLRAALDSGKTLAAVAEEKGVSVDTLVAALAKAERARIVQDVKDGRLTQSEADEHLKDLTTGVTERINSTPNARPDHDRVAAPGSAPTGSSPATPST